MLAVADYGAVSPLPGNDELYELVLVLQQHHTWGSLRCMLALLLPLRLPAAPATLPWR